MSNAALEDTATTANAPRFNFGKIFVLGFGFLGISLLWSIYDDFVPIFLQAGRPDFSKGAGVNGFGLGTTQTGFIMGLDNFAAVFILPFVGGFSDRLQTRIGRRKPFILVGAPIAAIAFALAPFALGKPLGLFIASLMITLLAMDIFRTPVVALMPDLTPPALRSQSNGIINFMGGLGGVVAALVGGTLFNKSPIAPFLLGAGGMLVAQAIVLLTVREPERVGQNDHAPEKDEEAVSLGLLPSLAKVVKDSDKSAALLLGAICFWFLGQSAWGTWFTSYVIQLVHQNGALLTTGEAVVLKSTFTTASLVSAIPSGAVGAYLGRKNTILLGLAILAASILACYFALDAVWMRPILTVAGVGWMFVVVNSLPLVLDFAPKGRAGTYTGLYYLASQTASFLGPFLSGGLFDLTNKNYHLLALYSPVMLLIAFAFVLGVKGSAKPAR